MAELQKIFQQSSNSTFNSDLLKDFVAKNRSRDMGKPEPQKTSPSKGGASIFTTTNGTNTTDNANILQLKSIPDNHHTFITSTTTTTTTTTAMNQNHLDNRKLNGGINANLNAANRKAAVNGNINKSAVACPDCPDPNANVLEVSAVLQEVQGAMSDIRQQLVTQVTEAAVDAHLSTCINTHQAVAEGRARFMAMKASGQLPDMSKLSLSAGSMWEKMMDQMMPEMNKTMQFFKILPGFSELGPDDQMKLIKSGMFEVMMTRFSMLIDHEQETMLDPSHKMVCPRHVVKTMPMGDFLDGFFHVGEQFNPIGLTDSEIGLFTAVLAFSPSRPGLSDAQLVASLQSLYQQALYCLLKENHSDPETKLSKVLSLVPMFRRINQEHSKALGAMKMQSPDAFAKTFPPVHKEMYSNSH